MSADQFAVETTPHRWRFWLLLIGVPVLVLVAAGVGWLLRVNSGLQSAVAEADRLDPRWRLEDIQADRATPPPGQNAADKIAEVKRLEPAGWPDAKKDGLLTDLSPPNRLSAEQVAAVKDQLGKIGPALAEARSLIDTPHGRHPVTYNADWISTLLPTIQSARGSAAILRYDVLDRAEAGDVDGAVRSAHAAFHAGCSIGDEPILIAQLVRIACQAIAVNLLERALAQGEPSDAVLAALQARLEAAEPESLLLYGLRGERAGGYQLFTAMRSGNVSAGGGLATIGSGGAGPPAMSVLLNIPGFLTTQQAGHLEYMNKMVELAKRPPEEWAGPLAAEQANVKQLPTLARLLVPAVNKVAEACQRNHALLRCAIVAIAAERYRRQHGQWPATPDDLVKAGLIKSVPGDPYAAGQRIKFTRAADGLIVYTTGPDGKDDGGKLAKDPRKAGTDYGFRLWDVAARRQPPLPAKSGP